MLRFQCWSRKCCFHRPNAQSLGSLPHGHFSIAHLTWHPSSPWALASVAFSTSESVVHAREEVDRKNHHPFRFNYPSGNHQFQSSQLHRTETLDQLDAPSLSATYAFLLRQCGNAKSLSEGFRIHAHMITIGHEGDIFLGNLLVQMYGKCGALEDAYEAFVNLHQRNVFSWTILIGACVQHGQVQKAFVLFDQIRFEGVKPNEVTFVSLLSACANGTALSKGKQIHDCIMGSFCESNVIMGNALINMYGKCGSIEDAQRVFARMTDRSVVSWNAMIAACAQYDQANDAFQFFQQMQVEGSFPNDATFLPLLEVCASQVDLVEGRWIQTHILESEYMSDVVVGTTLVHMYSRCGSLTDARNTFDRMQDRNVVSWNAMIAACIRHGQVQEGLRLFEQMWVDGVAPDKISTTTIISACTSLGKLAEGRDTHALIVSTAFESDMAICTVLIDMYSKCGSLDDAKSIFNKILEPDVALWNVMILGHLQHEQERVAVQLFECMQLEGQIPDKSTIISILAACASQPTLLKGKQIHACIMGSGSEPDHGVENALLNMYGKCGRLEEARRVFSKISENNVFSWNVLIGAYVQHGQGREALQLLKEMQGCGIMPDKLTFVSILSTCARQAALDEGKSVHDLIQDSGYELDPGVQNALFSMYCKCGSLEAARMVFNKMPGHNVVSWTAMITAYAQHGHNKEAFQTFEEMQVEGVKPNKVTLAILLDVCANLEALVKGKQLHDYVICSGFDLDVVMWNALISLYGKCHCLKDAQRVFSDMSIRDVFSWTAMIAAYAQQGYGAEAFQLYWQMLLEGIIPDEVAYAQILSACTCNAGQAEAVRVHACIVSNASKLDIVVSNALVNTYAKCGSLEDAQDVFDQMPERNVTSWNNLVAMYVQHGLGKDAVQCFQQMQLEGVLPNRFTLIAAFSACTNQVMLAEGKHMHASISGSEFASDVTVGNTLVNMYGKCRSLNDAQRIFHKMPQRDVVSWNVLIVTHLHHGQGKEVIDLFHQMQLESIMPDKVTYLSALSALANEATLYQGKWVHSRVVNFSHGVDVMMGNALVNFYGKCGSLDKAQRIFDNLSKQDAASWTAIINAYACHGQMKQVLQLFPQMQLQGMNPDKFTFLSVLLACSHSGLIEEGCHYFISMKQDHGISPVLEHYNCMIDLLGRSGQLDEAEYLMKDMPFEATGTSWLTFLGACRMHVDVERGKQATGQFSNLDFENAAPYILQCHIYTLAGMWDDAKQLRERMKGIG